GFAVFVDGAFALAKQIENLAEIDVAPDFGPLLRRLRNGLKRFAEGVGCRLVVLLVEESFTHTEVRERTIRLDDQSAAVLYGGIVVAAALGKVLTACDGSPRAQRRTSLENVIVGIDANAASLRAAKGLDSEIRLEADHFDGFRLWVAFGVDAQLERHDE